MKYRVHGGVHSGEVFDEEELSPEKVRGLEASGGHLKPAEAGDEEAHEEAVDAATAREVEKVTLEERKNAFEEVDRGVGAEPQEQVHTEEVDEARKEAEASSEPLPDDAAVHRLPTTAERNAVAEGKPPVNKDEFNREELNKLARERGVDAPEKLPNKAAVVAAINAA